MTDAAYVSAAVHGRPQTTGSVALSSADNPRDLHAYVLEDDGFRCQLCGRAGSNRRDVRNHVESVHFPHVFSYECAVCGVKLSSRKSLDTHKYRHHRPATNN